jgi:DHA3 family tetracycline resistance protein-like MFS transporter
MPAFLSRRNAAPVYLTLASAGALATAMAFTTAAVYYVQVAGLDPLQLVLLGTALELTYFLAEVPTGVFADRWSRRGSVVIGWFLGGVYLVVLGLMPVFPVMLLASVVSGLASAFMEGALEAWLADEVGEERVGPLYLRAAQLGRVFGLVGAVVGVALAATVGLGPTIVLAGVADFAIAAFLLVAMSEQPFPKTAADGLSRWRRFTSTTRAGLGQLRARPLMLSILLAGALYGAFTEAWDRLWEAHLVLDVGLPPISLPGAIELSPLAWFAVFSIGSLPIELAALQLARRHVDSSNPVAVARALVVVQLGMLAGVVGFGLATGFGVAVVVLFAAGAFRTVHGPLYGAWLNRGLDPATRATTLSMAGQADALGQLTGGPLLGAIGAAAGIPAALVAGSVFLVPAGFLYLRAARRSGGPEPAAQRA